MVKAGNVISGTNVKMRNVGLDIARSLAIFMVLISHGRLFFNIYDVQAFSINGFFGVELFFVLSGFLIGKIIIKDLIEDRSFRGLARFYVRRWLRTLPLYLLIVIVALCLGRRFNMASIFFVQNFNPENLNFIPVSWSLSIEEWFYLIIPSLVLIGFMFWKGSKKSFFIIFSLFIILAELALRIFYIERYNPTWDFGVRKQIFLRMDSLLIGVMLAGIKYYFKNLYKQITGNTKVLFAISLLGLITCGAYYVLILDGGKPVINGSFFGRTFLFTFVSLFFAVLVAALEADTYINGVLAVKRPARFFLFISVTSYAVYLIHSEVYEFFLHYTDNTNCSKLTRLGFLAVALTLTYIIGTVMYRFYELPILSLRDRLTDSKIFRTMHGLNIGAENR